MHSQPRKTATRPARRAAASKPGAPRKTATAAGGNGHSANGKAPADPVRSQLRLLSARLLEVREQERASISRRVHDELGQALTALQWDVAKLTEQMKAAGPSAPAGAAARLAAMASTISLALHTVRTVATELRPPMLDQFGLAAAVRWQAGEFQKRYGILCDVDCADEITSDPIVATALFRILQEALTNVARHAGASRVDVTLEHIADLVVLTVRDNGKGIPPGRDCASLGILGMRERARLVGGSISIHSPAAAGTVVQVEVPAHPAEFEPAGTSAVG